MFALHSSVDGYMGFFHVLVFVSHAVMDLDVQISPLQKPTSNAFAYILSSGGDGSHGDSNFHLGQDLPHHFPRRFHGVRCRKWSVASSLSVSSQCVFSCLSDSSPDGCEMQYPIIWFAFPQWNAMLNMVSLLADSCLLSWGGNIYLSSLIVWNSVLLGVGTSSSHSFPRV